MAAAQEGARLRADHRLMEFSVACLNLHCGLDRHGRPFSVADAVGALDADVVLVQENWRPWGTESLAARAAVALGYDVVEHDLVAHTPLADLRIIHGEVPPETGAWGLAMLSRVPWQRYSTINLGQAPGDLGGARHAQVVEIPMRGYDVVRLVNTHLTYKLPHGPGQLRRLVTRLRRDPVATVIGGDLNMCRPTIGLAAPYRPAVRGRSWPAHRPVAQIDHLLAGPGVTLEEASVLRPVGSDHLPLRAVVTLGGRSTRPPRHEYAEAAR